MRMNSNGKLAQFYCLFSEDGKDLPENFCTYFWGLVGRALAVLTVGGSVLIAVIGVVAYVVLYAWAHKTGTALVLMSALLGGFIIWIDSKGKKPTMPRFEIVDEVKSIVAAKVDSVKNQYCPRIEWK